MFPLVPVALASGVLTAGLKVLQKRKTQTQRHNLITALTDTLPAAPLAALDQKQLALWPAAAQTVATTLATLDDQLQHFFQTQIDPLLIDRTRREQLADLAAGREQVLGAAEQSNNRHIAIGVGAVATVGLAHLTALPLAPLVIATGFYLTIPLFRIGWQTATKERRVSVAHLLALYFTGMWLGGYYTIGAVGMILLGLAQKVMVICENSMRDNLVNIFGQQPLQVWVLIDGVETEIAFADLRVADILVLDVGQMVPIDGVIV